MKSLKTLICVNYGTLFLMNAAFYYAYIKDASHLVDAFGLLCAAVVAVTFNPLHRKTGIWKLTHSKQDELDEREIALTHSALNESYGWFAVVCLVIMFLQSIVSRMNICPKYSITVPLVASLIYFAHTLPGSFIAWKGQA